MIGHTMFLARHATQKVVGGGGRSAAASALLRRYMGPVRGRPKTTVLCSGLSNVGKRSIPILRTYVILDKTQQSQVASSRGGVCYVAVEFVRN